MLSEFLNRVLFGAEDQAKAVGLVYTVTARAVERLRLQLLVVLAFLLRHVSVNLCGEAIAPAHARSSRVALTLVECTIARYRVHLARACAIFIFIVVRPVDDRLVIVDWPRAPRLGVLGEGEQRLVLYQCALMNLTIGRHGSGWRVRSWRRRVVEFDLGLLLVGT